MFIIIDNLGFTDQIHSPDSSGILFCLNRELRLGVKISKTKKI